MIFFEQLLIVLVGTCKINENRLMPISLASQRKSLEGPPKTLDHPLKHILFFFKI